MWELWITMFTTMNLSEEAGEKFCNTQYGNPPAEDDFSVTQLI
jgi:hypothetical protein